MKEEGNMALVGVVATKVTTVELAQTGHYNDYCYVILLVLYYYY
jgi:hypothetical protein